MASAEHTHGARVKVTGAPEAEREMAAFERAQRRLAERQDKIARRMAELAKKQQRAAGQAKLLTGRIAGLSRGLGALSFATGGTTGKIAGLAAGLGDIAGFADGTSSALETVRESLKGVDRFGAKVDTRLSKLIPSMGGLATAGAALAGAFLVGKGLADFLDGINVLGDEVQRTADEVERLEVGLTLLALAEQKHGRKFGSVEAAEEFEREFRARQHLIRSGFDETVKLVHENVRELRDAEALFLAQAQNVDIGSLSQAALKAVSDQAEDLISKLEESGAGARAELEDLAEALGLLVEDRGPRLSEEFQTTAQAAESFGKGMDALEKQVALIGDVSRLSKDGLTALSEALDEQEEKAKALGDTLSFDLAVAQQKTRDEIVKRGTAAAFQTQAAAVDEARAAAERMELQLETLGDVSRLSKQGQEALREALQGVAEGARLAGVELSDTLAEALREVGGEASKTQSDIDKILKRANEELGTGFVLGGSGDAALDEAVAGIAEIELRRAEALKKAQGDAVEEVEKTRETAAVEANDRIAQDFGRRMAEQAEATGAKLGESIASATEGSGLARAAAESLAAAHAGGSAGDPREVARSFLDQLSELVDGGELSQGEAAERREQRTAELTQELKALKGTLRRRFGDQAAIDRRSEQLGELNAASFEDAIGREFGTTRLGAGRGAGGVDVAGTAWERRQRREDEREARRSAADARQEEATREVADQVAGMRQDMAERDRYERELLADVGFSSAESARALRSLSGKSSLPSTRGAFGSRRSGPGSRSAAGGGSSGGVPQPFGNFGS